MAIIYADDLPIVAEELSRRRVKLYHACQLADFKSYLQVGGVPSRNLLATNAFPYTAFDTDERDQRNGVWRLVFFNLSDFGDWFAAGKNTIPNPFGPVLLCFDPAVISQAVNVSITLRSAGATGFDRDAEGINADDLCRLFIDADSHRIRFAESLRDEFGRPEAKSPEMSCLFHDELASIAHLAYIRVDPYAFPAGTLTDIVHQIVAEQGSSTQVFKRSGPAGYERRYQALLEAVRSGIREASDLKNAIPDESAMSHWRDAILRSADLRFQFGRYAKYLSEGTVDQCM